MKSPTASTPKPRSAKTVTTHAWTFDAGVKVKSLDGFIEAMASRVEQSYAEGADIVLFPEYTWAAALAHRQHTWPELLSSIWDDAMPKLTKRLARRGKLVVLGTAPYLDPSTKKQTNRAVILADGKVITQDKLVLTPWEHEFEAGKTLNLIRFKGITVALLICLDIEIPEISAQLRGQNVDLILVPSATETAFGAERVTRCACARSVELGCAVIVSPIVGQCDAYMVEEDVGRLAAYFPSQAAFAGTERVQETKIYAKGFHKLASQLNLQSLKQMRSAKRETNPSLLPRASIIEPINLTRH